MFIYVPGSYPVSSLGWELILITSVKKNLVKFVKFFEDGDMYTSKSVEFLIDTTHWKHIKNETVL